MVINYRTDFKRNRPYASRNRARTAMSQLQHLPELDAPTIEVSRIGLGLWSVYEWSRSRDSGYCVGHFNAMGDANRAARSALKNFPGHRLLLAGWSQ